MNKIILFFMNLMITALVTLCSLLIVLGGGVIDNKYGKIEISSIDPWALALILFSLLYFYFYKKNPQSIEYLSKKFHSILKKCENNSWNLKASFLALSAILSLCFIAHLSRQYSLQTHAYDQTFMHQPLFHLLKCDLCASNTYLSEHTSYSLLLVNIFTHFLPYDEFVFFIQIVLFFIAIWFMCQKLLPAEKKKFIIFIIFILFCHRALRSGALWDFREDNISFFFTLLGLTALYCKKYIVFCFFIVTSMLSKENIPLITPFLSFPILFDKTLGITFEKRIKLILFLIFSSLIIVFINFKIAIPYFQEGASRPYQMVSRFPGAGNTPIEIIYNILTQPSILFNLFFDNFFNSKVIKYIFLLFIPYIYFLRKSPWWIIPALPGIAMNVFSSAQTQLSQQFHYDLVILPYLIFGMMLGILKSNITPLTRDFKIALIFAITFSGRWPLHILWKDIPSKESIHASFQLRSLPKDNTVLASWDLLAQLSYIKNIVPFDFNSFSFLEKGRFNENCYINEFKEALKKNKYSNISVIAIDQKALKSGDQLFIKYLNSCHQNLNLETQNDQGRIKIFNVKK